MHNLLIILQIIFAIVIIVSILMQPSKMDGVINLFSGATDTFYAHNKSKTREARLAKVTIVFSILFAAVITIQNLPAFIQK
ncbi:MAG: preprotein translocase subunit SecG [Clostridium sp.]|nr:preprotein translocase subunit SecG [Clostridium sp.]